MKHIKNMPNWLAHSIFVDTDTQIVELIGSEVDLFFALIYLTSQSYDHDKSTPKTTTFIYKKSKIQNAIKENKTLSVNIPAGVDNGDKVRLSGEGEWQKGGQSGDLYVAIRVLENPLFERDGMDLFIESPIPFEVSILAYFSGIPA